MARTATAPERLPFTGDDEADRLIAADPVALLIGFFVAPEWTKATALRFTAWLATNLLRVAAIALFVVGAVELVRGIFIRF